MRPPDMVPTVTVADARAAHDEAAPDGALLVDVREPNEFVDVRVAGAVLLPMSSFGARFRELPTDRPLHLICRSGNRSAMATRFLLQNGYAAAHNVDGGMIAWLSAGFPAVSGRPAEGEGSLP